MKTEDLVKPNGTAKEPPAFDKADYLETLKGDLAKLEAAAQERLREHYVLLGKAQAFRELIVYHENADTPRH